MSDYVIDLGKSLVVMLSGVAVSLVVVDFVRSWRGLRL